MFPNGSTELLALFGGDIASSPSPATHTLWAKLAGLNWLYLGLPCRDETHFLELVTALMGSKNFRGANITNPFKTSALRLPHVQVDLSASLCGAANTLYKRENSNSDSMWHLANTDLLGCSASLKKILNQASRTTEPTSFGTVACIILGNGAMAKTCSVAIEQLSSSVKFVQNTQISRTLLKTATHGTLGFEIQESDTLIVINTLPTGTSNEANHTACAVLEKISQRHSHKSRHLLEMSYLKTSLSQKGEAMGWQVTRGVELFETQARESFKLWSHRVAPTQSTALQHSEE